MAKGSYSYTFVIVMVIILIIFLLLFIANAWFWSRIWLNSVETAPVNRTDAGILFGFNAVFALIAFIALIYTAYAWYQLRRLPKGGAIVKHTEMVTVGQDMPPVSCPTTVGTGSLAYRL